MKKRLSTAAGLLGPALLAGTAAALVAAMTGGAFNLPASVINAGGGTASGGAFSQNYAIGGPGVTMSGGGFTLTPGPIAATPAARLNLDAAHAFPTPFLPSRGHDRITFTALTVQATVRVYTLSGRLVKTLAKNDALDTLVWRPVANESGEALASGVYLFVVTPSAGLPKKGKLMIVK